MMDANAADRFLWTVRDNTHTDWMNEAACKRLTKLFYLEQGNTLQSAKAKAICNNHCTVREECLDYAIRNIEMWGIWGGKTPNERLEMRGRKRHRSRSREAQREQSQG